MTLSEKLIQRLLVGDTSLFVVATGAGSSVAHHLWKTSGASKYLVGSAFPYASHELHAFLGFQPTMPHASEPTAIAMATEAYVRAKTARYIIPRGARAEAMPESRTHRHAIGLAITASVASEKAHRSDHRIHVAVVCDIPDSDSYVRSIILEKGVGQKFRDQDEDLARYFALDMLQVVFGLAPVSIIHNPKWKGCSAEVHTSIGPALRAGIMDRPYFASGARGDVGDSQGYVFFPGSFNPLHEGHKTMAKVVAERYHLKPIYTVCTTHVHKPPLSDIEILQRAAMFRAEGIPFSRFPKDTHSRFLFTENDQLFVDKMTARPRASWIMGADTLTNLLDPKWGPSTKEVIRRIQDTGSALHVFPCKDKDGVFLTIYKICEKFNIELPSSKVNVIEHSEEIPEIRSSEIRGL